jgi:hypothetical protein
MNKLSSKKLVEPGFLSSVGWRSVVTIFLFAFIFQLAGMDANLNMYDEGIILVGADRIMRGDVPYRDFWTMYGPGQFYWVVFLFKVFGSSDIVLRLSCFAFKALTVSVCYVSARRFLRTRGAFFVAVLCVGLLVDAQNYAFPVFPALALSLVSIAYCSEAIRGAERYFFWSGFYAGLATLFRHDMGFYNVAAVLVVAVPLIALVSGAGKACFRFLLLFGFGVAVPVMPAVFFLLVMVPFADLYLNLIYIPAYIYPKVRSIPFPAFSALLGNPRGLGGVLDYCVYVPFAAVLLTIFVEYFYVIEVRRQGRGWRDLAYEGWALIPLLAALCLFFTAKGLVRVSPLHMMQSIVISVILLSYCYSRANCVSVTHFRHVATSLALVLILTLILSARPGLKMVTRGFYGVFDPVAGLVNRCNQSVLPRLRCVSVGGEFEEAANYVMKNSGVDDLIYVGSARHDKVFVNGLSLYYMANRQPSTRWHELHPGIQTQANVQVEMCKELQNARLLVLDSRWDAVMEPNDSRFSNGVHHLDECIREHFIETKDIGTMRFYKPLPLSTNLH